MPIKAICGIVAIVICYGIYMSTTPGDGAIFATVTAAIGVLAGYKIKETIG